MDTTKIGELVYLDPGAIYNVTRVVNCALPYFPAEIWIEEETKDEELMALGGKKDVKEE